MILKDLLISSQAKKIQIGTVPYLEIGDINIENKTYSLKEKGSVIGAILAYKNSVLVSTVRPTRGAITIVKEDRLAISGAFACLQSNESICINKYLYYLVNTDKFLKYLGSNSKGATYPTCSKDDILNFSSFTLPSLSEQQSIVAALDKINELINANKRQLDLLDEAVKARFNDLFGDPIQNELKLPTQKLNSTININSIKTPIKPNINGEVWLLNLDMIESNTGNLISHNFVKPPTVGNSIVKFDQECVLYSKLRPYLNKVVVPDGAGYATSEILVMKPSNKINKYFLASLLRHQSFVSLVDSSSYGAKMPRASVDLIKEFDLLTPSFDLQIQFEEFFLKTSILKNLIKEQIICSEEILNKKMDEYFGGDSNA